MFSSGVMLAQVAPEFSALPSLYYEIARTGLMGVLFILVIYALVQRDKQLTDERAGRLEDAKAYRSVIETTTAARVEQNKLSEEHNRLIASLVDKLNELLMRARK